MSANNEGVLKEWLHAALDSAEELSRQWFEGANFEVNLISHDSPQKALLPLYMPQKRYICGAYIPLLCERDSLLLGLFSTKESAQELAHLFLSIGPDEDPVREDATDAVKEAVNIVSGLVQQRMSSRQIPLDRGLPVYVDGFIQTTREQATVCAQLEFGNAKWYLLLIRSDPNYGTAEAASAAESRLKMTTEDWLREAVSVALLFAHRTLGTEEYTTAKRETIDIPDETVVGAYIPLVGAEDAALVGLISSRDNFKQLACHFEKSGPEKAELSESETEEIIKEVLILLSDILKAQVFGPKRLLKRGLPVFVDGLIEPSEDQEASCSLLRMGALKTYLMIIRKKPSKG